ncbi:MAG: multidrug efflux RND transporter permease subunit [Gemmataceae bacterium]|nr:multidrug efflux RND transporter permease subunit [Gemmataceae bacterium]
MFSRFFIQRPIFASVPSILITLAGGLALWALPVAQYPDITPPTVQVSTRYPGANAQLVLDTVAAPIEQQISGVENMLYMSSQCTNDGTYTLTLTFKLGTDPNTAQVLVQDRVQLALPIIPEIVQRQGITVLKRSPNVLMIVNLVSPTDRYSDLRLSNEATIQVRDELLRLPGVGDVTYLGQRDYSMRAWLNPDRLATLQLSAQDVVSALTKQNVQVAAGQVGQQPAPRGQAFQLTMSALGRLTTPEQFREVIVKSDPGKNSETATVIRLRDVARVELGAQSYNQSCTLDGQPSVGLSIYQLPGSNALRTAEAVKAKMEQLSKRFPEGMEYRIVYDTTPFIKQSIDEVGKTLRDAVILVALVMLLFLQSWRAALIPLVAVPVAIVGTFAAMAAFGFSLNNLSLFGLVLAIGIVVDDAIVVVENVQRWLGQGLPPREAAARAMGEVTGPVVAVALVLSAVFVPCAFLGGITGQFFRQFALTIAVSTILSALNSLTLSPALAALLLRPHEEGKGEVLPRLGIIVATGLLAGWLVPRWVVPQILARGPELDADVLSWGLRLGFGVVGALLGWVMATALNRLLSAFFGGFNRGFDRSAEGYTRLVGVLLHGSALVLIGYAGLLGFTCWSFVEAPAGFIPQQDKGYLVINVQLPDGASVQRTQEVMSRIDWIARRTPGVRHTVAISGQSFILAANAPNFGSMYVMLNPFDERRSEELGADAIAQQLREHTRQEIQGAHVGVFGAPPVDGLGATGGFKLIVENRDNRSLSELQSVADRVVDQGNATAGLEGLFTSQRSDTPWIYLDIDRTKAMAQGVDVNDVFNTLQIYVGSYYVNNFNDFGRSWQVNVQADERFRQRIDDVKRLKVPNQQGEMVPLATLLRTSDIGGPALLLRYNMYSAAAVSGNTAPGVSSGDAVRLMDAVAQRELPATMTLQWTELTYLQILAGNTAAYVFLLAVVLVFLVLAAQYESWSLPLAVILVVPMCVLCAIAGVLLAHLDVNIFTQIGLVVLVGLASKNAVLIVQFAKQRREDGADRRTATLEACRLRLRPILMTSLAFVLGVIPLVVATGAGAEMRRALGTAVCSGMFGVTLFGLLLTPVFYFVLQWLSERARGAESTDGDPTS